ncbi:MAG: DUF756 domain-containing protein, partial [Bdellovibrionaceae bacterium]|nr:DUF756 domain-containing protein [Pseudobdellovibrionaceae bacterium]
SEAIDILTKNPEVWKKTIFILTYDENDGYFDHLPPFVAPKPDDASTGKVSEGLATWVDYEFKKDSSIGLGYRVPMLIASPWSKGGYVNSQVFDHTSSLMFLENFLSKKTGKKIKSELISPWRRAICGDLTSAFRPAVIENINIPDRLKKDNVIKGIQNAKSKPAQVVPKPLSPEEITKINADLLCADAPKQEKGTRLACALPYQLFVEGGLTEEKAILKLSFSAQKIGAPFNVYTKSVYQKEAGKTWAYAVKAGDKIEDQWDILKFKDEVYALSVDGPNGFYRGFKGTKNNPNLIFACMYEQSLVLKKPTGNLQLIVENHEDKAIEVSIKEDPYQANNRVIKIAAKSRKIITLNLEKSKGWYDFKVSITGNTDFEQHYAGHVETGADSISDPLMGGVILG